MNKLVNGILVELTPEEESEWLASQVVSINEVKSRKISELASYRYTKETAGITINGITINTDRESQSLITGAYCTSLLNPSIIINWKSMTGWVELNAAAIQGIAAAVATHVQACFDNEKVHSEAITALTTPEEVAVYDITGGWPNG